jgi:hypothetical protein
VASTLRDDKQPRNGNINILPEGLDLDPGPSTPSLLNLHWNPQTNKQCKNQTLSRGDGPNHTLDIENLFNAVEIKTLSLLKLEQCKNRLEQRTIKLRIDTGMFTGEDTNITV